MKTCSIMYNEFEEQKVKFKAVVGDNAPSKLTHSGNVTTIRNHCTCMPYIHVEEVTAFISYNIFKGEKQKQCGLCEACGQKDCGKCKFCLDKPIFGGPGRRRKVHQQALHWVYHLIHPQLTTAPTNTERIKVWQAASHTFNA